MAIPVVAVERGQTFDRKVPGTLNALTRMLIAATNVDQRRALVEKALGFSW